MMVALLAAAALPQWAESKTVAKDPVVMTVGGRQVHRSEFEYFYAKNSQQDAVEQPKSFDEYVELFVNYKLKVAEAYSQGVDTLSSYKEELAGYRKQLTEPYLTVPGWGDSLVEQYHARRQWEVHAQHLLLRCDENASNAMVDSLYNLLLDYQQQVKDGADFGKLCREHSEEPSAKQSAGDLGYFGPLQMVYPFEQAAYNTPVGETSIVRSRFGMHLVKVLDRRQSQGEVMVSHIMKNIPRGMITANTPNPKQQIDSIYALLQGGANYEELCAKCSDDNYNKDKGGVYPWLSRMGSRFPEEWLNMAYSLEVGEVSKPFATQFGWHIMKLIDKRAVAPRDAQADARLKEQMMKDEERMKEGQAIFLSSCRQELASNKKLRKAAAGWSDDEVLAWADGQLEERYPEFKNIYREYHDGLMLFEVSSKAVWDKAAQDSVGLQHFFEAHRANYNFESPRFKGAFIECVDDDQLYTALKDIYDSHDALEAADVVRQTVLKDTLLTPNPKAPRFHIVNGLFKQGDNAAIDAERLNVAGTKFTPKEKMPRYMTYGRLLTAPEELDDVRGAVVADYQSELEAAWVAELKKKFEVKINQKELDKLR